MAPNAPGQGRNCPLTIVGAAFRARDAKTSQGFEITFLKKSCNFT
jgi:hypothetical protein